MNLILFGFKSSGKTHFGKILSSVLKRPFIDTDDLICQLYEKQYDRKIQIRNVYQVLGETSFRVLETEAIHQIQETSSIIAVGGGSILNPCNILYLQKIGQLVYLKAGFDMVQKRILERQTPSFIDPINPFLSLHKIYQERTLIYEAIQAKSIDTNLLSEEEVIKCLSEIINLKEFSNGL